MQHTVGKLLISTFQIYMVLWVKNLLLFEFINLIIHLQYMMRRLTHKKNVLLFQLWYNDRII